MAKKKDIPAFTHSALVDVAVKYLNGAGKCHAVLADLNMNMGEIPDAIGWSYANHSTLIEVKVSRSDFHADKDKLWRQFPQKGMGRWRYYMVPKGMLSPSDLDDFSVELGFVPNGWGLLEVDSAKRVRILRKSMDFKDRHFKGEMKMMIGALRRVQIRLDKPLHKFIGPVYCPGGITEVSTTFVLDKVEAEDAAIPPWHDGFDESWTVLQ